MIQIVSFSDQAKKELKKIIASYPNKKACLLPVLHLVQKEFGYVSNDSAKLVANTLGLSIVHIREAMSFYALFSAVPRGKYVIQVCRTLSCAMSGQEDILAFLKGKLRIKEGEVTPDGVFELKVVECLGECSAAPVIRINDAYCKGQSIAKLDALLKELADSSKG